MRAAVQRGRVPPSQHPMFAAAAGQMAAAFAAGNGMSLAAATGHPHHSYLSGFVSMLLRAEPYPPPAAYAAAARAPTATPSAGQSRFIVLGLIYTHDCSISKTSSTLSMVTLKKIIYMLKFESRNITD